MADAEVPTTRRGPLLGTEEEPAVPAAAAVCKQMQSLEVEESASPSEEHSWNFWYPTWDTWKFQRTLAYWISVMYLEGAILFTVGAAFSMSDLAQLRYLYHSLVAAPYLAGGICFMVGSYLGVLEAVNAPNKGDSIQHWFLPLTRSHWTRLLQFISWRAVAGYVTGFAGSFFLNVSTVAGFFHENKELPVRIAALLGPLFFLLGGLLACYTNKVWELKVRTGAWWLSIGSLVAPMHFLVAGIAGLIGTHNAKWLVDFPYLVGSAALLGSSEATLWMWKCEQFGLGFMPELNLATRRTEPRPQDAVTSMNEEYGCGRATAWQLPFLTMYLTSASASVIIAAIALQPKVASQLDWEYEVMESVLNVGLSHGVMMLGSVVHHVPTARPHSWMVKYLRVLLVLQLATNVLTVKRRILAAERSKG